MRLLLRAAAYLWPLPYTCMAITVGWVLRGRFQVVDGVVEIHGKRVGQVLSRLPVPAAAITIGHAVLGQNQATLDSTRTHERVHVRQYERWGIVFIPAYLLCSAFLWMRGRDAYRENPFEVEAYTVAE